MQTKTEYVELFEFLAHKNKAVQAQAVSIMEQFSGEPDSTLVDLIVSDPDAVVRPVLRLLESEDSSLREGSLTILVNLSVMDAVAESICKLSGVRRVCDSLNQYQRFVELHCMLLSNITRLPVGIETLLGLSGGIFRSIVLKYSAVDSEEVDYLGSVIINGTSVESGRKLVAELQIDGERFTHCLLLQCLARSLSVRRRRSTILQIIRNVCLDSDYHQGIAASGILINMCYFLYPQVENRREEDVHESIVENSKGLASDVETRTLSAEILVCCLRSETGRDLMRTIGMYEVVRLWDLEETDQSIKDMIYDVAMATHMSEKELQAGELDTTVEGPPREVAIRDVAHRDIE